MKNGFTGQEVLVNYAISTGALRLDKKSGIVLKSGRMSPYFFNSGLFNNGTAIRLLAKAYASVIPDGCPYDAFFGPAYKGIPLSSCIAMEIGGDVEFFSDRKEEKDHGEKGAILGGDISGKNFIIIDDVMSTGGSVIDAHKLIVKHGAKVRAVVIAFDRQEKAKDGGLSAVQEYEQNYDIPVYSAANLDTLIGLFDRVEPLTNLAMKHAILNYKEKYGVWKDTLKNKKSTANAALFLCIFFKIFFSKFYT